VVIHISLRCLWLPTAAVFKCIIEAISTRTRVDLCSTFGKKFLTDWLHADGWTQKEDSRSNSINNLQGSNLSTLIKEPMFSSATKIRWMFESVTLLFSCNFCVIFHVLHVFYM
jgi:hypothetical protein